MDIGVIDIGILIAGIMLLFFLIVTCKINSFLALMLTAIALGFALGMGASDITTSITKGIGATLGGLTIILSVGSMLGRLMADSGAAQQIAHTIINTFGARYVRWSMCIASSLVGFALFYEVGFILLIPIVFTIAKELRINPLEAGIPMAASLSVTHGFLPPHPGPTLIAEILSADMGLVLIYGIIIAIPTCILAGPLFYKLVRHITPSEQSFSEIPHRDIKELPSFFISILSTLIPIVLMSIATFAKIFLDAASPIFAVLNIIGNPNIALLIAIGVAIYTLGIRMKRTMEQINQSLEHGVKAVAMILLVIAGGGVLKQVLIDSGLSTHVSHLINQSQFSPLIAAWLIAASLRIALGSASVAAITAGSIILPLAASSGIGSELFVLAIGAGSVIFSLPNDPGFWMFKEFFHLSIKQTLLTWSMLETIIAVCGLLGVLVLHSMM